MASRPAAAAALLAFVLLLASSVRWMTLVQCRREYALDAKLNAVDVAPALGILKHLSAESAAAPSPDALQSSSFSSATTTTTTTTTTALPVSISESSSLQMPPSISPIRKCTATEAAAQGGLVQIARVKGCGAKGDNLMRIVHLNSPRGAHFIDIGSNKGYSGAHFFQLWEPEYGFDLKLLQKAVGHSCGVCGDCNEQAEPIVVRDFVHARFRKRNRIRVFSFDGSTINANNLRNGIARLEANYSIKGITEAWTSENAALAGKYVPGATVKFVSQREVGHIAGEDEDLSGKTVVIVPVVTVDHILERERLTSVEVVKIDTEGFDPFVIQGAEKTLKEHKVLLLLFEYHFVWPPSTSLKNTTAQLEMWGYVCYLEGQHGLLRLNYGCWTDALEVRTWSNVWCLSTQKRAGLAIASAFDTLTLVWM